MPTVRRQKSCKTNTLSVYILGKTSDSDRVEGYAALAGENDSEYKQGLQLRLSQQLAMTPQLQRAIRLLQLSTLELQQELQQALENNPLLEQTDLHDEIDTQQPQDNDPLDTADALEQKEMPEELPLDASW
ncbi:RNA polymerase factor sigma-54, partial [Cronobacter sakazakii]